MQNMTLISRRYNAVSQSKTIRNMIATAAAKSAYLLQPQLTSGSLPRHLPRFTHSILLSPIITDLYKKLLTRGASLSPNEATRVSGPVLMETSFG